MYTVSYRMETYDGVFCGTVRVPAASSAEAVSRVTDDLVKKHGTERLVTLNVRT